MNATFAALLDVAYAQGGGLLKFGGDALLLLYDGDEHAAPRRSGCLRDAPDAPRDRPAADVGGRRPAEDARRPPLRPLPVLPGRGVASRAARHGPGSDADGRDGGSVGGRRDPRRARRPRRCSSRGPLGEDKAAVDSFARPRRSAARSSRCPSVEGIAARGRGAGAAARTAARGRAARGRAPARGRSRSSASPARTRSSRPRGPRRQRTRSRRSFATVQAAADEHDVTFLESDIDRDGGRIILVSGAPQTFGDDEERMLRTLRAHRRRRPAAPGPHRRQRGTRLHGPGRARASGGRTPCSATRPRSPRG